jgi:hypothetical protein
MKQKAAQELLSRQSHFFLYVSMRPISPGECHFSILKRDQAMVGYSHSMGIVAELFEDMFGTAEWALAMDDPIVAIEIANEAFKHLWIR